MLHYLRQTRKCPAQMFFLFAQQTIANTSEQTYTRSVNHGVLGEWTDGRARTINTNTEPLNGLPVPYSGVMNGQYKSIRSTV